MRVKNKPQRSSAWRALRRSDDDSDDIEEGLVTDQQMPVEAARDWRDVTTAEVESAFTRTYKERRSGKSAGQKYAVYQHKVTGRKVYSLREAQRYLAVEGDQPVQQPVQQPAAPWLSLFLDSSSSDLSELK